MMVFPFRMIYYYLYTVIYPSPEKNQIAMIFLQDPEEFSFAILDFF